MAGELEPYCTWPFHLDRDGNDLEAEGCPVCFWWSLCYFIEVAGVDVQPPMARSDYIRFVEGN